MEKGGILEWPLGRLDFSRGTLVMGVLNVTPDSFSDGGEFLDVDTAVSHGLEMVSQGAAIIDVGPESSRPGSQRISPQEQIDRAAPVIERLAARTPAVLSIDTYDPAVAAAAMDAGAGMINDITALGSPGMAQLAAERGATLVLMHMLGTPETMQKNPEYGDVTSEVLSFLLQRAQMARAAGIPRERIFLDPGIGFGKTQEHNLQLLRDVGHFVQSGYRILVGTSRKRFIGTITGRDVPAERVHGTTATVAHCAAAGVNVVRVHDVPAAVDTVKMIHAIKTAPTSGN